MRAGRGLRSKALPKRQDTRRTQTRANQAMVDISTCETRMRKHQKIYHDPETFYIARKRAGLTVEEAAEELNVTTKTIRNWENGQSPIPYCAYRLMRMLGGYQILGDKWEGWAVYRGALWSPIGRSFYPWELHFISTYIQLSRLLLAEKAKAKASSAWAPARPSAPKPSHLLEFEAERLQREQASPATAGAGVRPAHGDVSENEPLLGLQEGRRVA